MKLSPLDLCHYFVVELRCSANSKFDVKQPIDLDMEQLSVDPLLHKESIDIQNRVGWSIDITISYQPLPKQNNPYSYSIRLVGFFSSPSEVPENLNDERLVWVNGCSMLYGIAREKLRAVTAAGPWGEFLIPTVSFIEVEPKLALEEIGESKTNK